MNFVDRYLKYFAAACVAAAIGVTASNVLGQVSVAKDHPPAESRNKERGFCSNNNWGSDDRVSYNELREIPTASTGSLNVDAGKNGGISVKGEERSDVLIRACIQAWAKTEESAKAVAGNVKIETGGTVRASGQSDEDHWSVSYQILVPRATNLKLEAHNGGVSISGVDGTAEFQTMNGGVSLANVSGDVKGRTTNGGVNITLSGNSWKGSGLDVQTTNGGVNLTVPENYAAHVETGTVNGGFKSDFPNLNVTTEDFKGDWSARSRVKRVVTNINGGGAPIKVITTNGGINIHTTNQ